MSEARSGVRGSKATDRASCGEARALASTELLRRLLTFAVMLISAALRFLWACRRSYAVSFLAFVVVLFAVAVPVALMARVALLSSMTFSANFASLLRSFTSPSLRAGSCSAPRRRCFRLYHVQ